MGHNRSSHRTDNMYAKLAVLALLAASVAADKRPSFNSYQPPEVRSYEPPRQTYQEPEPTYQEPEQTYEAPSRPAYNPQPAYSQPQPTYHSESKEEGMPFAYNWAVADEYSGNQYNHNTNSDGEHTEGEYRVLLPDGRTQIVKYTSDPHSGFQAEVTYEGEARPYEPQPSRHQNSYEAPRQTYQEPQNTYEAPKPTYQQPKPAYQS